MEVNIRIAQLEDSKILAQIGEQTFREAFEDNNTSDPDFELYVKEAFALKQFETELKTPTNLFLLAENELNEPIGYGKLRWDGRRKKYLNDLEHVELERIYVTEKYLGCGVGKAMMEKMLNITHTRNFTHICLSVYEKNPRAIRFYERFGFKQVGLVPFKLGDIVEDDILMLKQVF